jgi:hypothetical protein
MAWFRALAHVNDLTLGLGLSVCLGVFLGLLMGHPWGRLICGSAIGVAALLLYVLCYSIGTIWLIGVQQGLVVVTVFVWCLLLSSAFGHVVKLPSLVRLLG